MSVDLVKRIQGASEGSLKTASRFGESFVCVE